MKTTIAIACYNECPTISEVISQAKSLNIDKEIIIVDNCSTDGTREILESIDVSNSHLSRIAKAHGLKIITSKNKGHGAIEYINQNPDCSKNEVMENVGISEARLRVVLDKEKIELKSDEKIVLDFLSGKREINPKKTIEKLKITPHSLYKIVVKHDLEIL